MSGPLSGLRVLDLCAIISGPYAMGLLADLGADVIKVEPIGDGDRERTVGSIRGISGHFHHLNRGKQSIALDLRSAAGRDVVHRLAASVDLVAQNFRPGVADRLGVGYEALRAINPRLVYLSISGYGSVGPKANDRAYDPAIQAYTGMLHAQGGFGGPPVQVRQVLADKVTAHTAVQAVLAALWARERDSTGQHVEVSMLHANTAFTWIDIGGDCILQGDGIEHRPPIGGTAAQLEFADGHGVYIAWSEDEFQGLTRVFDLADVPRDPRFATMLARSRNRVAFNAEVMPRLQQQARAMPLAVAEQRMSEEDVPFSRVRRPQELPDDAQLAAIGAFRRTVHPVAGEMVEVLPPARYSATPAVPSAHSPLVGEHARDVLRRAGYADADIDDLHRRGVVASLG
jgi:crotonobetainyl-CoA:carnitine CoA-transferase CaiB-like acyl-CoA transferase